MSACCCTRNDATCTLGVHCPHIRRPLRVLPCSIGGLHFPGGTLDDWGNFLQSFADREKPQAP